MRGLPRVGMSAEALLFLWGLLIIQSETRVATLTGITWAHPSALLTTATNTTILAIAWTSISLLGR
jgi:hypothetical protein